ncbi:MAG TPA: hypothetical protein VGL42_07230 [Opitutaceae bacterium]|jgi:uncharacterized protein (TIGR00290 family)
MREKVIFCWSGGKDSALALNRMRADDRYEIVSLLTTCNGHYRRVSMHGVRVELLEQQAAAVGLPLEIVEVSQVSSNEEYRQKMGDCMRAHQARGVTACVYGDIFLEDLRAWREANLAEIGLRGLFPLWKIDTRELIREFVDLGFGSVLCCVNDAWLGEADVGRVIDRDFIGTLPAGVDPCGENGEYHSFAFAGPIFQSPVRYSFGEKVYRPVEVTHNSSTLPQPPDGRKPTRGFWFCDLLPA